MASVCLLTGLNTSLKMLWMLFHGLAAVKLIRHLLCTFPSCASIGNCSVFSIHGLVLRSSFYDVLSALEILSLR